MYFGGSILLCDYERMRPGVRRAARYAEGLFPKYRRAGLRLCHIEAVWNASALEKGEFLLLFLRAAAGTVGVVCNFYAVDHLVLSDATMLNKMSPFFAILFSFLLLKENLKIYQIVAVIGSFVGSLFTLSPRLPIWT